MIVESATDVEVHADTVVGTLSSDREPAATPRQIGATIGRYVVLETLGEGGMGTVYAAYDPELDRKLAIKILKAGRNKPQARERLRREAQALARLSHANVVAVHDVGSHGDQVFVAMEFIAGRTLGRLLEAEALEPAAIIRLFRGAGEGLAAAHRAGLVHRDFKPDNVMVDGEGRARVVDFGLAHAAQEAARSPAVDASLSTSALERLTVTGALMGTPAYMAPEQFRGTETDARTDIFAFCVALYEALYGERPFAGETIATLAVSIFDGHIRESPRSTKVSSGLRRVLLRGLATDPGERYASMEELLAEVDRALAASRRRRRRLAAAGLALAGGAAAAVFALKDPAATCRRGSAAVLSVWDEDARRGGARAFSASELDYASDAWARAESGIDAWVDAWTRARDSACVDALVEQKHSSLLLDRRLACFDRQLSALAGVVELAGEGRSSVVARIGDVVVGLPPATECSPDELLEDRDHPDPPPDEQAGEVAELQRRLIAADTRVQATYADEDLARVDALLEQARALEYRPLVAEAAHRAAANHYRLGRFDAAEERYLEALHAAESSGDVRRLASILPSWAELLVRHHSAFREGEHVCSRTDALLERIGGSEPIRFTLLTARALVATERDTQRAIRELQAALELGERIFGPEDPRLANIHNNLSALLIPYELDVASAHVERAREIWERALGAGHPKLAYAYRNLGRVEREREDYAAAVPYLREALARFEALDPEHPAIGAALHSLAQTLEYRGDPDAALVEYKRSLEHVERNLGPQHVSTLTARYTLGGAYRRVGQLDAALREVERAATSFRKRSGLDNPMTVIMYVQWLRILTERGELAAARELRDELEPLLTSSSLEAVDILAVASLALVLAELAVAEGRPEAAQELVERALELSDDSPHDYGRADARFTLARVLVARGGDRARAREQAAAARASWSHWPAYYERELTALEAWARAAGLELDPAGVSK